MGQSPRQGQPWPLLMFVEENVYHFLAVSGKIRSTAEVLRYSCDFDVAKKKLTSNSALIVTVSVIPFRGSKTRGSLLVPTEGRWRSLDAMARRHPRSSVLCPCPSAIFKVALVQLALFILSGDGRAASAVPVDDGVLQRIPVRPHQSKSELCPELADLYQPAPSSTMLRKLPASFDELETLVSLSIPGGETTKYVELNGLNVGDSGTDGQTWCTLDILDFSVLKAPCNNPAYFLPAMAVTPDQRQLVLFGFGPLPQCHNVFIWEFGLGLSEVLAGNGERVAHALHAIAVGETTEKRAHDLVSSEYLHVFSYGGMKCDCFSEVHGSKLASCIRQCKSVSDTLWQLTIPKHRPEYGQWEEVPMAAPRHIFFDFLRPLLRPCLHVPKSTNLSVILFGGVETMGQKDGKFQSNFDVWFGFLDDKEWIHATTWSPKYMHTQKEERGFPIMPRSAYVANLDQLVLAFFGITDELLLCGYGVKDKNAMPSRCTPYAPINGYVSAEKNRLFLTSGTTTAIFVQHVLSPFVYKGLLPNSLSNRNVKVKNFYGQHRSSLLFPGSSSCYSPAPASVAPIAETGQTLLFAGGSCTNVLSTQDSSIHQPLSMEMTIWTVLLQDTRAVYTKHTSMESNGNSIVAGHTLTQLDEETLLVFGGLRIRRAGGFSSSATVRGLHMSKATFSSWTFEKLEEGTTYPSPMSRAFHIAFPHDSNSIIIHGGFHHEPPFKRIHCDIWILYVHKQDNIDGISFSTTWTELTSRIQGRTLPCVFGHTYTVHQGVGLIYGGTRSLDARPSPSGLSTEQLTESDNSLIYTIVVSPDAKTVTVGSIPVEPPIPQRTFHSLSTYTTNSLLLLGGVNELAGNGSEYLLKSHLLPMTARPATVAVLIKLNLTIPADMKADAVQFFPHLPMTSAHIVNRSFIFSGQSSDLPGGEHTIAKLDPDQHCPLGYGRSNSSPDCERCPKGYYSDSYDTQCKPCKQYRATNTTGSTDCYLVSPCKTDFCHGHGVCKEEPKVYQAICICDFGYLVYDNCQVPFVSLAIIAGVVLFVCLLTYALIKNQQRKSKIRKQGEKLHVQQVELDWKKKKLDELFDAVHVHWKYLFLIKRLYPDPQLQLPAGSTINEVWEAELGDMPVAVKVLKSQHSPDSSLKKFVHEAEILRVVNHPNIVNFLGAGTQRNTQRPFLIMELVRGGSLYQLLQNTDIDIDHKCRLSFAIDGAKGMEYLHGCNPSKIHRDLKSANLLVTSRGHVKVADFGTTRFIEILDKGYSDDDDLLDGPQRLSLASRLLSGLRRHFQTGTKANDNAIPLLTTPVNHPVDMATGNSDEPRLPPMTYGVGTDRWKAPETLKQNYFDEKTDVYRWVGDNSPLYRSTYWGVSC